MTANATDAATWICGYCLLPVVAEHDWAQCEECGRVVHADCWREQAGCVTLACSRYPKDLSQIDASAEVT